MHPQLLLQLPLIPLLLLLQLFLQMGVSLHVLLTVPVYLEIGVISHGREPRIHLLGLGLDLLGEFFIHDVLDVLLSSLDCVGDDQFVSEFIVES